MDVFSAIKFACWLVLAVGSGIAVCERAIAAIRRHRSTDLVWLFPVAWLVHALSVVLYPL